MDTKTEHRETAEDTKKRRRFSPWVLGATSITLAVGSVYLAQGSIPAPLDELLGSRPFITSTLDAADMPIPTVAGETPMPADSASASTTKNLEPVPAVPYTSTTTDPETGLTVYELGQDQLGLIYNEKTGNFNQYAPLPANTFTRAESQCDLVPKNQVDLTGKPTTWSIPDLGPEASTGYTQTNFQLPATIDDQGRYGTWKTDTAHLTSTEGVGFYAGHVNDPDGSMSAWAYSHQVTPCMSKYITDENGVQQEYQASELYLLTNPADVLKPKFQRMDGPSSLVDVTCAGPNGLGDDGQDQIGGSLWGYYPYRVVVVWDKVIPS